MRVPISAKAEELLRDPKKARALAEAIRESRKQLTDSFTVPLDGRRLTVKLAGSKTIRR